MGFEPGHPFACWKNAARRSSPEAHKNGQLSLLGNAMHSPSLMYFVADLLVREGVLPERPTAEFLADPCSEGEEVIGVHDAAAEGLVKQLVGRQTHRGGDLRKLSGPDWTKTSECQAINAAWW